MPERREGFCSEVSLENAEPLAGTASRVDHWILVEYRGLWGYEAVGASGLADEVKRHLREQRDARPYTKLLFVRRPHRRDQPSLALFWGSSPARGGSSGGPRSTATRTCSTSTSSRHRGGAGPSAAPRLHARQARPMLRPLRAAAVPGARGTGGGRVGLAGVAPRRRSLCRQRRLPARGPVLRACRSRRRPGRCWTSILPAASSSSTTADDRRTRSPSRQPRSRSGGRPACEDSMTSGRSCTTERTCGSERGRAASTSASRLRPASSPT